MTIMAMILLMMYLMLLLMMINMMLMVPYGIDGNNDDNVDVRDDDACHNNYGYCTT